MMKLLPLTLLAGFALVGCSSSDPTNGAPTVAAPKSEADLPASAQGKDREAAMSGIGSGQAQQAAANDPARVRAMQEMNKQRGG